MLDRVLEPEVMDTVEEAVDYDAMDHAEVNRRFVDDLLAVLNATELAAAGRTCRLMDLGTAPIHVISIMDPQIQYARNLQTIVAMMKGTDELHPHSGWIVQVTQQSLHRFVSTWTIQLVYKNVRFHPVDTLSTALHFLKDRDVTLAALDIEAVLADYAAWKPILHNAEF